MKHWLAFTCLATSMALVGSYVALSKPLVAVFPVFLLAWLRFGIATVAMAAWLKRPADEQPLRPTTKKLLFLESFLGNFMFSICMLYGVSMTSASSAGVILSAIPAMVAKCGVFERAPACQVVVSHWLRHCGYWFVRQHQPQRHICNTPSGLAGQPAGMCGCVLRGSLRRDWQALNQPLKPQAHCITHQPVGFGIDNTHGFVLVAAV